MASPSGVIGETTEAGTPLGQLFTDLIAFAVAIAALCGIVTSALSWYQSWPTANSELFAGLYASAVPP